MRGFIAFALAAALLGSLVVSASTASRAIERGRDYSQLLSCLQQLKALREDVKGTVRQVLESAEGETAREKAFDAARKLISAEGYLEGWYAENGLDLGFGACGSEERLDFGVFGETWEGDAAPLAASILYWDNGMGISNNGRAFFKDAPLFAEPCVTGEATAGGARMVFWVTASELD